MHTGELIRELRERRGLSQKEVADLMGVTQPVYSRLEARGDSLISTLDRLAAALGVELRVTFVETRLR